MIILHEKGFLIFLYRTGWHTDNFQQQPSPPPHSIQSIHIKFTWNLNSSLSLSFTIINNHIYIVVAPALHHLLDPSFNRLCHFMTSSSTTLSFIHSRFHHFKSKSFSQHAYMLRLLSRMRQTYMDMCISVYLYVQLQVLCYV